MSKKALKLDFPDMIPQLVDHYKNAHKRFLGVDPYIHKNTYPKFSVFEDDLRDLFIPPRDYAYTLVKLLVKTVKQRGWKYVPVSIFLSDYGIKRYEKITATSTVNIDIQPVYENEVSYDEIRVARRFIQRNLSEDSVVRFSDVVGEMYALLSKEWLFLYRTGAKRPKTDAVKILAEEFGVKDVNTYRDIIKALR